MDGRFAAKRPGARMADRITVARDGSRLSSQASAAPGPVTAPACRNATTSQALLLWGGHGMR